MKHTHAAALAVALAVLDVPLSAQPARPPASQPSAAAAPGAARRPAPPPVFEGSVTGPDSKPIAEAVVMISAGDVFEPPMVARTDGEGRFRITARRRGPHTVRVESAGLAARTVDKALPGTPLRIALAKGGAIEGVVRDAASGEPVAGARVEAREDSRPWAPTWDPSLGAVRTTTDAKGAFRLEGLAVGRHTVAASARPAGRATRPGVAAGQRVELLLVAGPAIVGRVTLPDGKPAARAAVRAEIEMGFVPVRAASADASGRYELAGLTPGKYRVIAVHDDAAIAVLTDVRLDQGEVEADVQLPPPARVTGRLVGPDDRPVEGSIVLGEVDGIASPRTIGALVRGAAGADGRFVLERVPPGSHALTVSARGLAQRRVALEVPARAPAVDLGDVVLEAGPRLAGRVTDKAGAPIADAVVRAFSDARPMTPGRMLEGTTDADGAFALGGATAGRYSLSVSAPGHARYSEEVDAPRDDLRAVLGAVGTVAGSVEDAAGRAVTAFDVIAMPSEGMRQPPRRKAFTDDSGRFTLDELPSAGTYSIQVTGRESGRKVVPGVKVGEGTSVDLGRIVLDAAGAVRGIVLDPSSAPVAGASVEAVGGDRMMMMAGPREELATDAAGRFEIRGLAPGRVVVVARHPAFAEGRSGPVEVDPARPGETSITLFRGGRIAGTVRRRNSGPAPEPSVMAASMTGFPSMSPGSRLTAFPGPDGTFSIERVPPGRVGVALLTREGGMAGTGGGAMTEVEVREGETTQVDLVWRDILLKGKVTRGGAPLAGVRLMATSGRFRGIGGPMVESPSGPQRMTAVTREDGSYEMIVGDAGRLFVQAESTLGPRSFPTRVIEVADVDAQTVDIDFPATGISGLVVDEKTEAPIARAHLSARPAGEGSPPGGATTASADGRFTFDLAPGDFTVLVAADGYATKATPVTVGEGPSDELRIALSHGLALRGTVVDDRGRPAGGQLVSARTDHADAGGTTRTSLDGRFEFSSLDAGAYTVSVGSALAGYGSARDVRPGEDDVVITLHPGGKVRLRARGADGAPIAEAFARVLRVDGAPFGFLGSGRSGPDGVIEIDVPAGAIELEVRAERLAGATRVNVAPGETADTSVVLAEEFPPPR